QRAPRAARASTLVSRWTEACRLHRGCDGPGVAVVRGRPGPGSTHPSSRAAETRTRRSSRLERRARADQGPPQVMVPAVRRVRPFGWRDDMGRMEGRRDRAVTMREKTVVAALRRAARPQARARGARGISKRKMLP